jgi:hypothetical protein
MGIPHIPLLATPAASTENMMDAVRDRDTSDSELRLLAAVRRVAREHGAARRPSGRWMSCWTNACRLLRTNQP